MSLVIDLNALDLGSLQQAPRHGDAWDPAGGGSQDEVSAPTPHLLQDPDAPSTAVRL